MADSPASGSGAGALPGESPAQAKARLRRERLAAKSGAARLQQITALQGGPPKDVSEFLHDVPAKPPSQHAQTPIASGTATPDPDEVDISQHHVPYAPQPRLPSPFASGGGPAGLRPPGPGQTPDPAQDPIMAMLQQMMGPGANGLPSMSGAPGQAGAGGGGGAGPNSLPPELANLFAAMNGDAPTEPPPDKSSAWAWRLVHSVFSLGLAIYIVLQTPFTGSRLSRQRLDDDDLTNPPRSAVDFAQFFYIFATFEVILQSSRYFVERGQFQGSGLLNTITSLIPAPYAGFIRTIGRYSVIYNTVVSDAAVIVFVLGATSWWRGAVVA